MDVHSPAQRRGSWDWVQGENPKLQGAEAIEIKTLVENEKEGERDSEREPTALYFITWMRDRDVPFV